MHNAFIALLARLRRAGITAADSEELRLHKSLMVFVSGLTACIGALWFLIYWALGPRMNPLLPALLFATTLASLARYLWGGSFESFRKRQLMLLLIAPFLVQWAQGDVITASGMILWGMLAPLCAVLTGRPGSTRCWLAAYLALSLLTAGAEFWLLEPNAVAQDIAHRLSPLFFALNFSALACMLYLMLRFSVHTHRRLRRKLGQAHASLAREQARSEALLLNVLPAPIAQRLLGGERTIADGHEEISVLFADIVNFTELATHRPPAEVFTLLNNVFGHFDQLVEARGLEKIKTIGDAYMVAGGLNARCTDAPAALAELALAMRAWINDAAGNQALGLQIRIGIGTGPVVAGVVGHRKFSYDLWGDTVNLASRITAECPPGTIQCDARSFARLRERFAFQEAVTVRLKGKGMVSVWRLLGPRPAPRTSSHCRLDTLH